LEELKSESEEVFDKFNDIYGLECELRNL